MEAANVQEAKTHLSRLLARVEAGERIAISRAGVPIAELVPVTTAPPRVFGPMVFSVPEDFDAPLGEQGQVGAWG